MSSPQLVLITGAANGIGRSIAVAVGKLNFNIAAWDIDKAGLALLKEDLLKQCPNIKVSTHVVDISDNSQVKEAVKQVEKEMGPIYCLVNNAGVIHRTPCLMKSGKCGGYEDWMKIVNVNVVGNLNVTSTIYPLLASRKRGHVVNMSSTMGVGGLECQTVYTASKHFIEGLSKSLRKEGLLDGVKVTVVRPSGVITAMTEDLDTASKNVDRQSVDLWNEMLKNKMKNNLPILMESDELGKAVAYAIDLPHEAVINELNISAIGWPEM